MRDHHWITRSIRSEEGIYGLILVSGVIATAGGNRPSALFTLLFMAVTVIVFWAAHVYAGAVAVHGTPDADGTPQRLGSAIRHAILRARGMLAATTIPALILVLGVVGVLEDTTAIWLSLWAVVALLAGLGYLAYVRRAAAWYWCLVGAAATASFGVVIIVAKIIITH